MAGSRLVKAKYYGTKITLKYGFCEKVPKALKVPHREHQEIGSASTLIWSEYWIPLPTHSHTQTTQINKPQINEPLVKTNINITTYMFTYNNYMHYTKWITDWYHKFTLHSRSTMLLKQRDKGKQSNLIEMR